MLSKEFGAKLTKRYLSKELFPFSFDEFLRAKKRSASSKIFEEYLYTGGFPEYVRSQDPRILNELLADVLQRDISVRVSIKNDTILKKLALYLISNVGKEFSYNSLKKMFEVKSVQTIIDYIHYLENSYMIFTIPSFSYSYKKQQVNPKKVYSVDNGFSSVNSVSFSKDKGRMLENAVFLELRRRSKEIFFYREGKECDFLLKENGKITQALQVCYFLDEENKERELSGLLNALKEFSLKKGKIITFDQEDHFEIEDKKIELLPLWKWMLSGGDKR